MKKLLLAILLTIISTSAMAEWTQINWSTDVDGYIDIATKIKVGDKVKMWSMSDLKAPKKLKTGTESFFSFISQWEYDCVNETSTLLAMNFYTGNMQKGRSFDSLNIQPSERSISPIAPNTSEATAFEEACGKK